MIHSILYGSGCKYLNSDKKSGQKKQLIKNRTYFGKTRNVVTVFKTLTAEFV